MNIEADTRQPLPKIVGALLARVAAESDGDLRLPKTL